MEWIWWSKSSRKKCGWGTSVSCFFHFLFILSLCLAFGLLHWQRERRHSFCFPEVHSLRGGAVLTRPIIEICSKLWGKMNLARKARGGLPRSDFTCSDFYLQILADGKGKEGWEGAIYPAVVAQVLICEGHCWDRCINKLLSYGRPIEGRLLQDHFRGRGGPPLVIRRPLPFQSCYPGPIFSG